MDFISDDRYRPRWLTERAELLFAMLFPVAFGGVSIAAVPWGSSAVGWWPVILFALPLSAVAAVIQLLVWSKTKKGSLTAGIAVLLGTQPIRDAEQVTAEPDGEHGMSDTSSGHGR